MAQKTIHHKETTNIFGSCQLKRITEWWKSLPRSKTLNPGIRHITILKQGTPSLSLARKLHALPNTSRDVQLLAAGRKTAAAAHSVVLAAGVRSRADYKGPRGPAKALDL